MRKLDQAEIESMLVRNGVGVLSLLDDDKPYGIPMSFGYGNDDIALAMQMGTGYEGRKERCIRSNANACLTVYEGDDGPPERWRSIVITGELYRMAEREHERAYRILAENAVFAPDVGVWGRPIEEVELAFYGLDIDETAGREFSLQATE